MSADPHTGEILDVSPDHAKRWAERARLDLEASADRGEAGLSKIRTAMTERHDVALGYRSLADYLNTEYADALGNVCRVFGVEFRRQVVGELTQAGLSTRAIASVVGTSQKTVSRDQAGESCDSPGGFYGPGEEIESGEPMSTDNLSNATAGEEVTSAEETPTSDDAEAVADEGWVETDAQPLPPRVVTTPRSPARRARPIPHKAARPDRHHSRPRATT